jgi:hypothetical protein
LPQNEPITVIMIGCGKFSRYYHVPILEADTAVTLAGIFDPSPSTEVRELAQRTGAALVGTIEDLPSPAGKTMAIVTTRMHCTLLTSPRPWGGIGMCSATSPS